MTEQKGGEKFQRKVIASFKQHQLLEILQWFEDMNRKNGGAHISVGKVAEDITDEKRRERFITGISVLHHMTEIGKKIDEVHEVLVWQTGPEDRNRAIEYKFQQKNNRF